MDAALEILDPLVLDRLYAYLVPAVTTPTADGVVLSNGFANNTSAFSKSPSQTSSSLYESAWPRDNILRQCASILLITQVGATLLYWVFSAFSYYFIFDRRLEYHPRFLKNQIRQEIVSSMTAVPWINIMTLPFFLAEVRGKSFLYTRVDEYGWAWMAISTVLFLIWNDFMIYWIHRLEHHPSVYKYIHKPHHKWIGKCTHFARHPGIAQLTRHSADAVGCSGFPPARWICSIPPLPVSFFLPSWLHCGRCFNMVIACSFSSARCKSTCTWFSSFWSRFGRFLSTMVT